MKTPRIHEWAWGDIRKRTVCGQVVAAAGGRVTVVNDLGAVDLAQRCKNCERMRAAIGTSRDPAIGASA
jgi:hypothetical protein